MAAKLDNRMLELVFQGRPDILADIKKAADTPARVNLFNHIASFVHEQLSAADNNAPDEPASKRRRVDIIPQSQVNGRHATAHNAGGALLSVDAAATEPVLLEIKDISIVAPQRKKYDLCFTKNFLYARASGSSTPVPGVVYPWRDVEHAFYLPVPDKSQVQYNYVLFPRDSFLPTAKPGAGEQAPQPAPQEPLVFTVPATAPKPGSVGGLSAATAETVSDTYSSLLQWALTTSLRAAGNLGCALVAADAKVFHSAARQAYRPAEKAVHVKAFRGSKDGYLFFLPTGILWGFKKPLLFLPLDRIVAVSYTNVLQRTFNIAVELEEGSGSDAVATDKEIEFGMLDQEDYQSIDEMYVRRHGLADGSMAERRKAKRELAENAKKAGGDGADAGDNAADGAAGGEGDGDGLTVLERAHKEAEQLLQDDEDEDEEDYDPGSEGDSEGSGESSDDDDDDDDGRQRGRDGRRRVMLFLAQRAGAVGFE
ncbi:hypothetical protein B0T26DRAFT_336935 [Lasiosphaeria miniovina]|uniref:Histone chaperone RTT106/FACT complex subunit SPT16-like middle domain-containing protein n=1 Tax=Lasiosphaeria miniovina TaxID=1954250 RepID=A0AA40AAS2_9PEZI|nr:uncharacterized protein B0T26DRAFT_336935 [Lasiosphaeria miniovina]KAK0712406.1 hypothetical protein B0T26DRAFT_336935 [Lasiosphaeria miniovina]